MEDVANRGSAVIDKKVIAMLWIRIRSDPELSRLVRSGSGKIKDYSK
jgi:hypothetical protein